MLKKLNQLFDNKIWKSITDILFPIALAVFALMNINKGITVTDTGYNYGNFVFVSSLDNMWKFSTYLANVIGSFFTNLPFGSTMIGLNFYTGLIKLGGALLSYFCCIKICKMRKETVFLAECMVLGFCWCPTALIYNYMTYFLFTLSAMLIYIAFEKEKSRYFVLAGISLGLNFMVRLPNVVEVCLIFAVWAGGVFYKKKFGKIVKDTIFCMCGYLGAVGSVLLYIGLRYGIKSYVDGILALFEMSANATSYSTSAMIISVIQNYLRYSKWILLLGGMMIGGIVLFKMFENRWLGFKKALMALAVILYVALAYVRGMYTFDYRNYTSMFFFGVMFLVISLAVCGYTILFTKMERRWKLLAAIVIVIILITPIGSNNQLYSPINNLFLVSPIVFSLIGYLPYDKKRVIIKDKINVFFTPVKIILVGICIITCIQGICFGANFVFRDGVDGAARIYSIENNSVLKGMKTTEENARNLQELNDYVRKEIANNEKVLLYGNVPALAFYFSMEPAISTAWPDLDSFSYEKFKTDLGNIESDVAPVVIVDSTTQEMLLKSYYDTRTATQAEKKIMEMQRFLKENNYMISFRNNAFVVYKKSMRYGG